MKKNACLPVAALLKPPQVGGSGKNWVFEIFLARIDTVEYKGSLTKGPCPLLKFLSLCCLEAILCTINIDPLHGTLKKQQQKLKYKLTYTTDQIVYQSCNPKKLYLMGAKGSRLFTTVPFSGVQSVKVPQGHIFSKFYYDFGR